MSQPLITLLYAAFNEPIGIVVETPDPEKLRQKLYAERKKADDPDLAGLSFLISPSSPATELWILNRNVK